VVLRAYDAWNRADLEAALAVVDPDVEWRGPGDLFLGVGSIYRGHAGVREWWALVKEPWEYFRTHVERTIEGAGKVVTVVRFEAVGRESGAPVELPFSNVWEIRDGLVVRFDACSSLEEALELAGLRD
jgi:ketosteroid isomerase-like protein